eukprot:comp18077_c0_seq1/m.18687 comp18077_c0_seq1/g.18687  ORF comp18077_c0_seq1/g.18687 comp18077_c0_seq1/m.18687 type:complete len:618 (-) comp18077_c0_seq1:319-2172(-)
MLPNQGGLRHMASPARGQPPTPNTPPHHPGYGNPTTFSANNPYASPLYSPIRGTAMQNARPRLPPQSQFNSIRRPLLFQSPYADQNPGGFAQGPSEGGQVQGDQIGGTTYYPTSPSSFQGRRKQTPSEDQNGTAQNPALWTGLEFSGAGLINISPSLWKYTHLTTLLLNNNKLTAIPAGIAELKVLTKLDLSDNKLRQLPEELGSMRKLRELNLSNNELATLPYSLGKLIEMMRLELFGNPLQPPFSVELEKGWNILLTYLLDNMPVPPPPPERPYLIMSDDSDPGEHFSVLCYNVLCDVYATRQMYGYCPTWALDWNHRREVIKKEIVDIGADIVCLQEVETSQFHAFFLPELRAVGYEGVFHPKTRSRTMSDEDRKHVDGCAILFRAAKFSLLEEHLIDFRALAVGCTEMSEDMMNRVMPKDNIAVACVLELRNSHTPVLVSNAHIHWNPIYKDVKLVQTAMLLSELKRIITSSRRYRPGGLFPLVVCGDFNSLPDSGVYELLAKGHVPPDHTDLENTNYGTYAQNRLGHSFSLRSSYNGELAYTNYTHEFKGVIDYIWFSQDQLTLTAILGPVPESYMEQFLGCPNSYHPSDHFPLVCELKVKQAVTSNGAKRL